MEQRGVDRVGDEPRIGEVDPESAMRFEAVPRLDDRRVRELAVDLGDPRVGSVVEATVGPDRPVDAMDEAHVVAGESAEAAEVEVERVEEARRRPCRDAIELDGEAAPLELRDERAEELVPSARRRRCELVEEREVGTRRVSGSGRGRPPFRARARQPRAARREPGRTRPRSVIPRPCSPVGGVDEQAPDLVRVGRST